MSERFILNETSYFGRGSRINLANEIKTRGFNKVLVVTDKTLYECGVTSKVTNILDNAGVAYNIYSDVKPNPTVANVQNGVDRCREVGADLINPDRYDVVSLNGVSNTINKGMPMIALPTTHGTAAEVTINYVITDEERKVKMVCVDPHDIPIVAIIDSELMESLPKMTAAATGLDALTHAVEGYITKAHNTMSDMFHLRAIELIFENLEKAVNDKDIVAIENMAMAQYMAGMGFSNVGLGIVHSMAHQLGAVYDTPHGIANAILLPTVMRFNGEVCSDRFRDILAHLGRTDAYTLSNQDVINTFVWMIEELSKACGVNISVKDTGCKEEDLEMLAEKAMEDPCKPGNPREVTKEDFIRLFREAM